MKTKSNLSIKAPLTIPIVNRAALLLLLATLNPQFSTLAQGTAFTYQGRLNDGAGPANGSYDLRFILYNASIGGSQQGPIRTNSATPVVNGLFIVTLDFTSVDQGGLALAAIQGLNQKLEQKETEITELQRRLDVLEKIIHDLKSN